MTGKIELFVRLGKTKDERYDKYPYWGIKVTGENGKTVFLTPEWKQFEDFLTAVKVHEIRVDLTRDRKKDADNWEKTIKNAAEKAQKKVQDFDIPRIYKIPKLIGGELNGNDRRNA